TRLQGDWSSDVCSSDLHWDMLESYIPGLQRFILEKVPKESLFIGLDERTAMAGDGEEWQVFGLAGVHVRRGGEWIEFKAGDTFRSEERRVGKEGRARWA